MKAFIFALLVVILGALSACSSSGKKRPGVRQIKPVAFKTVPSISVPNASNTGPTEDDPGYILITE